MRHGAIPEIEYVDHWRCIRVRANKMPVLVGWGLLQLLLDSIITQLHLPLSAI